VSNGRDLWSQWETRIRAQDYAGLASLFATDAVYVEPAGRHEGRGGIGAWLGMWNGAFSDVRLDTSRVVEQGAVIVAEWTWRNTNTGPLTMPDGSVIPPTDKTHDSHGVTILEVRDGQIVTARDYYDPPIEVT